MKTDIVLKTLVINSEGNILLLRRNESDTRRPLQWDLPGGIMEDGESLEQGAVREVKEESGIEIIDQPKVIFSKAEVASWDDRKGPHESNVIRIYFVAHVESPDVTLSYEHDEYKWVTFEEALEHIVYNRHREVIQYVLENKIEI